ncbi:uncharacterized protein LOC114175478 [Vigna unguiculata]|uniref:uncharacterized protein LOC114175478 n=1 Tax=Vigna unguiculata TaxID=3917 RepID=UPI0010163D51|nr:uncharacterized protein LOC114175478 [Vigna unguiculata]
MCPAENRLAFSVYMLTGEAEHWWSSTRSILEERDEPVTWETFRDRFLSEYFPDSIRYAKEVEFLQLTQGGKTVTEYAERFKHLSRFYTLPLDEEWRCRKFENGLRGDIRLMGYRRCNNCGKEGHFGKDCPTLARAAARLPVQTPHQHQRRDRGNRPQATGRVYAMTGAEAAGSGDCSRPGKGRGNGKVGESEVSHRDQELRGTSGLL